MSFGASTYPNFIASNGPLNERLFLQYIGPSSNFDIIIIGSGIGGGVLGDDLADRIGRHKRILILEAGSFLYPTHVYNMCRFPNASIARHFACDTFVQQGTENDEFFIGEKPQLNMGGRSIFWSGLIPTLQSWELEFYPEAVRNSLESGLLAKAGEKMNESVSMGKTAADIVSKLRQTSLAQDFTIRETPRALHQPYLSPDGIPKNQFFTEPTGVFNTAELIINQLGLTPGTSHGDGNGLQLKLNHFVEDVQRDSDHRFSVVCTNTLNGATKVFRASSVVIAGGSIESPKLIRRSSSLFNSLPQNVRNLIGRGLTDHPTTAEITTFVTNIENVTIPKTSHAKIIMYSKGRRDDQDQILYPFNVEMNINHEYWHLRENDPNIETEPSNILNSASRIDIKFSFGNCLDESNKIETPPPFGYLPELRFKNQTKIEHLAFSRFPALAGWNKTPEEIFAVLNRLTHEIFSKFQNNGQTPRPENESWFGKNNKGFGYGTVHHAIGSLRMPYRPSYKGSFIFDSVVDENLQVRGTDNLYVCDMSVLPFSSAANPVRTLVALALRLSQKLA
ncbi:GMC oxidoreductase [Flavitalea antarctica]